MSAQYYLCDPKRCYNRPVPVRGLLLDRIKTATAGVNWDVGMFVKIRQDLREIAEVNTINGITQVQLF